MSVEDVADLQQRLIDTHCKASMVLLINEWHKRVQACVNEQVALLSQRGRAMLRISVSS